MANRFSKEIAVAADKHGLDSKLVTAVVFIESSFNPRAYRFERAFWDTYLAPNAFWKGMEPERVSASYGLMQVLFVVAHELGYDGEPECLMAPSIGLEWGCAKLAAELNHWRGKAPAADPTVQLHSALASYNGGRKGNEADDQPDRNAAYADKVLRVLKGL